jgi:uncharacterized protein YraI
VTSHIHETLVRLVGSAFLAGGVTWACAAGAAPGTVFLTTYLRAGPGEQYAALDEIAPRSQVDVQSCASGWCRVRANDATGFIRTDVLSAPDIHAAPTSVQGKDCFTARLNGRPRSADDARICDRE